ncbi:hypothetical protein EXIGLDRAFT_627600, partial [Exidia glandulosa HHB12029]
SLLSAEAVMHGFFLHALLRDSYAHGDPLKLPHHGLQETRMEQAMHDRNVHMSGTGQPLWAHACDDCTSTPTPAPDRFTGCVIDGITVGHPCCSFTNEDQGPCREPLRQSKDRYCPSHLHLMQKCAFRDCSKPRQQGFQTCTSKEHRATEEALPKPGASIFQLKDRLHLTSEAAAARKADKKSGQHGANKKGKAVFRRTWTHNEQLAVRPCGIVISRATMYQAEAVSGDFIMATFPENVPGSHPSALFYDDNCVLEKFIRNCGPQIQRYFARILRPVDVFHFARKHKLTDVFCQENCNPASFPELTTPDGKWVFNSSAAEQANVWFGKYATIVREMSHYRYNFFLDEMILLHNQLVEEDLHAKGKRPHIVPQADLYHPELRS